MRYFRMPQSIHSAQLIRELSFTASRSSGAGGQHVNKVNSKVTLKWDVRSSRELNEQQKELLLQKLSKKLTEDGVLILTSQASRSQVKNKEAVLHKLDSLLARAFRKEKVRKTTKPTRASKEKRMTNKRQQAEKKQWRKKI